MKKTNKKYGFGVVEVFVGVAIISIVFFALASVFQSIARLNSQNIRTVQASFLAEEGIEAVKIIRNTDWSDISNLSVGTDYFLTFSGGVWVVSTNNQYVDGIFERKVVFEDVFRDANDDISTSGTTDPGSKKVILTVSWPNRGSTSSISIPTYITELF